MKLKKIVYSLSLLTTCLMVGCGQVPSLSKTVKTEPLSRTEFVLGTTVSLSLYDTQDEALLNEAFKELKSLENTLSVNEAHTLIDEVNAQAGVSPVSVDPDTYSLIEKALSYSNLTDGAFDITIGPLTQLWHIGFEDARIPSSEEIQQVLPLINYNQVILSPDSREVYLTQKGMALDLGGIAKGYAADKIAELFKTHGTNHALIDLGGNIYTLGTKVDGSPWKIGVQDPFHPRGEIIGYLTAENQSIVTSGIYERYIEDESGHTYHHLLNPKTGYPFENDLAGVTILSPTSIDGDALSTSVFAKGLKEGLAFVENLKDIEAIFISTDSKVYLSSGLKDNFVLTSEAFTLQ